MANLREIQRHYDISYRHNPKHFYGNSFAVEHTEKRLLLVAVVKRHVRKRFRVVGVLRPKSR